MTESEIKKIHKKLMDANWGLISPYWFKYVDFSKPIPDDYDADHILFQGLLQGKSKKVLSKYQY